MTIILYVHSGIPGDTSFGYSEHASKAAAARYFAADSDPYFRHSGASASAYMVDTPEDLDLCREFSKIGCPLDYPDYILSFGPRGGVKVEGA